MNTRILLSAAALMPLLLLARQKEVTLTQAGTLHSYITDDEKYTLGELKVNGPVNGADILFIREMAGVDVNGDETDGFLSALDLSGAALVASADVFYRLPDEGIAATQTDANLSDYTFSDTTLEYVTLPQGITRIGQEAFAGCFFLRSVSLPDGLEYVGVNAFQNCMSLADVHLPATVTTIDEFAFQNCKSLRTITLPLGLRELSPGVLYQCNALSTFDVPATVESIGDLALFGLPVTELHLPAGLQHIGRSAFNKCAHLKHLYVDESNPLFSDEDGVLFNKDKSALLRYPQARTERSYVVPATVRRLGYAAFSDVTALQVIGMPGNIETIEANAFFNCAMLRQAVLPATVTSIGDLAFFQCSSLNNVELPAALTNLGTGVFGMCEVLPAVDLSHTTVATLALQTFYGCYGLTSVRLPATLAYIDRNNFYGCSALTALECLAVNPPTVEDESAFTSVSRTNCRLLVPEESVAAYQAAPYWREFTQTLVTAVSRPLLNADADAAAFNVAGQRVPPGHRGLVVSRGRKRVVNR